MKNIAIINSIYLSPYAFKPLYSDKSAISLVKQFSDSLPGVEKKIILATKDQIKQQHLDKQLFDFNKSDKGFKCIYKNEWNTEELLKIMESFSSGYNNIIYFCIDCPFLDSQLTQKMFTNHMKYMADYTFADGYPYGFTPEIIKTDIIKRLILLHEKEKKVLSRQTIFEVIKNDINSFDIETELAPKDQRLLRIKLSADNKRNFLLLQRIMSASGGDIAADTVCTLLDTKPEILRTLPKFFSIQITGGCPQKCTYCPYPLFGNIDGKEITENFGEMEYDKFKLIIDSIIEFCEDAVISISLWGEPSLHNKIIEIAESVISHNNLSLIIETSGIGWKSGILSRLSGLKKNPITWIVSLDAWTLKIYEALRGKGFQNAYETAETLLKQCKDNVYIQAVRMKENEDDLEHFYVNWKKKTEKIIIQKYDHFCGLLPQKKVTDLSPLHRFPCWHIKRDMAILIDGSVPLCREETSSGIVLGNVFKNPLQEIWQNGEKYYLEHVAGNYQEICRKCDEYYTFNF